MEVTQSQTGGGDFTKSGDSWEAQVNGRLLPSTFIRPDHAKHLVVWSGKELRSGQVSSGQVRLSQDKSALQMELIKQDKYFKLRN